MRPKNWPHHRPGDKGKDTSPHSMALERQAAAFARRALAGQKDKAGDPLVAHAERMAMSLEGTAAKQTAYLHDVCEDGGITHEELLRRFPRETADAVHVLTRQKGESYTQYIDRVAAGGELAIHVKLADLNDHLTNKQHIPSSPYPSL